MMWAAARYARDEKGIEPPPELILGLQMRAFPGALPEPGGLRDQRAGEMSRIVAALNVYDAWRNYQREMWGAGGNVGKWAERNPEQWRIVGQMMEEEAKRGR